MAETFPNLTAAPIVEAVIHWRARAARSLQPHELQELLTRRLPEYPKCQPQHYLEFQAQLEGESASTVLRRDTGHGLRLTSEDGRQIVQFTRDGVAFSRLTPYERWDAFAAEGQRVWRVFLELAQPTEIQRLGVRFINRVLPIELPAVARSLASPPQCLEPLGLPLSSFLYQSLHDIPNEPLRIKVVQAIQPPVPPGSGGVGLIVDIDVFTTRGFPPDDGILQELLPKMRWFKNKAFFSLMSKAAINSFKRQKQ